MGGGLAQLLQNSGVTPLNSYRAIVIGYGVMGLVLLLIFTRLSVKVEAPAPSSPTLLPQWRRENMAPSSSQGEGRVRVKIEKGANLCETSHLN